jgi:poly(A)-specific ribonuclease
VERAIESCSFMAIDCELSGLKVTDEKDNFFETVEERYHSVKKSASEFLIVQFGLVAFFYDEVTDCFTHKAYNFYTFPRQSGRYGPNIRFLCESSSIEFLCSCGFDFNKLFYSGNRWSRSAVLYGFTGGCTCAWYFSLVLITFSNGLQLEV